MSSVCPLPAVKPKIENDTKLQGSNSDERLRTSGQSSFEGGPCHTSCVGMGCTFLLTWCLTVCRQKDLIIRIIITDLYTTFRAEDTEALDAAQED